MYHHVVMILAIALGAHPLPSCFPLLCSNTHVLCFTVLALAAFLAFHIFQRCVSSRRVSRADIALPYRYLPSYSNRLSPVNSFLSAAFPNHLVGRLRLRFLYHWLCQQWPTCETPEVCFFFFPLLYHLHS